MCLHAQGLISWSSLLLTCQTVRCRPRLWQCLQEMVLVLEDDMQVLRWPDQGLIRSAPPGWEVLQLYMLGKAAQSLYMDPPALWVPWRPGIFNTGAYIVNRAGMRKVSAQY